jgi:pantoate--beta-alanine ligase
LSPEEREKGLLIYASIKRVEELFKGGERNTNSLRKEAEKILSSRDGIDIEYINISDAETLKELDYIQDKKAVLAIACRIGKTRLIDNTILTEA